MRRPNSERNSAPSAFTGQKSFEGNGDKHMGCRQQCIFGSLVNSSLLSCRTCRDCCLRSSPTETRFRLRFRRRNCQISWFRPGFGYGRNSHFGFGLVSVTAVTRNLVSAYLRPAETQILSSANTESYYSLSLTQSLPARMLSWLLVAVVLRDPARRAKVVTPLAGSQWEFMLDSRHSLSYLIFRPSGRDIGLGVGDHIGLVARQR